MNPAKRQAALDSPTSPNSRTERRFGLFRRGDGGGNERFGGLDPSSGTHIAIRRQFVDFSVTIGTNQF